MISDPRQYTIDYPQSNTIIQKAIQVLSGNISHQELEQIITDGLKRNNDALINVAINLSPNYEICKTIWQALNNSINPNGIDGLANIFAVPVILVAGSKTQTQLAKELNVEKLNHFFTTTKIFKDGFDCFISGKLLEPQLIAKLKPSQLYYWSYNLQKSKLWLPIEMIPNNIQVLNEGVFLRFLVGVTVKTEGDIGLDLNAFKSNSMQLMQQILNELKVDGVTLFPIPIEPVALSEAFIIGNQYRQEIAIQVAFSNIVRKIRQKGQTPFAILGTQNEAIKIKIMSKESADFIEESLWHLNKFDDFTEQVNKITNLLKDIDLKWEYEPKFN